MMSKKIPEHIDLYESTLSLAMSCICYLCQQHQDSAVLGTDDVPEKLLSGEYILHEFASSNWLELTKRLCSLVTPAAPSDLVPSLEKLLDSGMNLHYDAPDTTLGTSEIDSLKVQWPEIHDLLAKYMTFHHARSSSEYRVGKGMLLGFFLAL